MMRFRSKPVETEAMRWHRAAHRTEPSAEQIVAWVNDNGGEARYMRSRAPEVTGQKPLIGVRTINGWAYAEPGHYVVMGEAMFPVHIASASDDERNDRRYDCRDFYPCDSETFDRRWTPVSGVAGNPEGSTEK